ncbi:hypothetical protein V6N12_054921 [Hibiscus sabdariffa]|uniref:Uncharacterized protein n=1 Tax=Hibiscus sabdariffa TaxID=183260 RepID=A0ABR2D1W7_9ROSI
MYVQARPLFSSRRKFSKLADLLLQGRCPIQALAAASMCTREQAATPGHVPRGSADTDEGGSSGRSSRGQDADKRRFERLMLSNHFHLQAFFCMLHRNSLTILMMKDSMGQF